MRSFKLLLEDECELLQKKKNLEREISRAELQLEYALRDLRILEEDIVENHKGIKLYLEKING